MPETQPTWIGADIKNAEIRTLYKYQLPPALSTDPKWDWVTFSVPHYKGPDVNHPWIRISCLSMSVRRDYSWNGADWCPDVYWIKLPSLVHDAFCQLTREGFIDSSHNRAMSLTMQEDCLYRGASKFQARAVYWATLIFGRLFR